MTGMSGGIRLAPEIGKSFVRVLGTQLDGRFVEFEFYLNDPDLTVELVMPASAFDDFCSYYQAEIVSGGGTGDPMTNALRQPGLYRAPSSQSSI